VPDLKTTTGDLDLEQTMWDRAAYYALRPELYYDRFADVGTTDAAPQKGIAVSFTFFTEMAAVTAALTEDVDVDAVPIGDTQVVLDLAEYGSAVNPTWKVRATSFIDLDRPLANLIGYNAGLSQDTIAQSAFSNTADLTNVRWPQATQARMNVGTSNVLTAAHVRRAKAELTGANVATFNGYYAAMIHPDVAYDFTGETGTAAWRDPHTYSAPENIWNGEIGAFEKFRFMESPRAPLFADASNGAGAGGNIDVYRTLFFGRQAFAKAYSTYEGRGPVPSIIIGPVIDKLRRFRPVGWHWFGGYKRFRTAAMRTWETASTIGANT
jgi:N4-gp56 family major capsid protein